jgi:hypothetical protein
MKITKAGMLVLMGAAASGAAYAHPGHVEDVAAGFTAGLLLAGLFIVAGGGVLLRRWLRRGDRPKR